jgi:hypothetical protein
VHTAGEANLRSKNRLLGLGETCGCPIAILFILDFLLAKDREQDQLSILCIRYLRMKIYKNSLFK